jgi:predicted metal-dependent hydrolase
MNKATEAIEDFRTKWGSCSKNGDIAYNWKIIMASNNLVDYVVIHELCHLKELNHSPKFWKLLDRYKPDWRECKLKLANRLWPEHTAL